MSRSNILIALFLLLAPFSALAYATPEEILFPAGGYNATQKPPINRESGDRTEEQRLRSEQRRQQEFQAAYDAQHPPMAASSSSVAEEASSAPSMEEILSALQQSIERLDGGGTAHEAAPSKEGRDTGMSIEPWENPKINTGGSDEVLHSGAPLTPTGAGTWIAVSASAAAIGWTMWNAKNGFTVRK